MELLRGVGDVARGGKHLLARPRLWIWILAPALTTLVLLVGIAWGVYRLSDPAVAWVAAKLPDAVAGWVSGLLHLLVVGGMVLVGFVLFVTLAGVVAGPFCEMLSERVEEELTGRPSSGTGIAGFFRGLLMGLGHTLRRLAVSLFGLALVLVLGSFVPIVGGLIAAAVAWYLSASAAAYDCFDAVLSRRMWPYQAKLEFLRANRGRTLGLGGATTALLIVPVVNLAALGIGATAATLAALELEGARPPGR